MKPTIIYVSGAPGSGKTTLANKLAEQLYLPRISSDLVKGGLAYTDPHQDRNVATGSVFVPLLIEVAEKGVSYVVDHVLQKQLQKDQLTMNINSIHYGRLNVILTLSIQNCMHIVKSMVY
jgi:predicted kinase